MSRRDITNGIRRACGNLNHLGISRAPSRNALSHQSRGHPGALSGPGLSPSQGTASRFDRSLHQLSGVQIKQQALYPCHENRLIEGVRSEGGAIKRKSREKTCIFHRSRGERTHLGLLRELHNFFGGFAMHEFRSHGWQLFQGSATFHAALCEGIACVIELLSLLG